MDFKEYLNNKFPGLILRPPLFYNWDTGIRFELGDPKEKDKIVYMNRVYFRAITLFKELHAVNDSIIIVVNACFDYKKEERKKIQVFNYYVKDKDVLYKLKHETIPYIFSDSYEDTEDYKTHRYFLHCKVSDIAYIRLIKAICNHDMGIKPLIYHDVFFINLNRDTIFRIYDDRGCDVISVTKEPLKIIYEKYNDWILDYDREDIDNLFKTK